MIYFFRRGGDAFTCETRLAADGSGFELVITGRGAAVDVERFPTFHELRAREHALVEEWRSSGWRDVRPPRETPADTWSGPL